MDKQELIALAERVSAADRVILNRLDRSGECWLWTGALDSRGRGRVWRGGKIMLHHRAVWEILIGPIPKGALLCHHCDNPTCANPAHIYVGDDKSNVADMWRRGRAWHTRDPDRLRELGRETGKKNNWCRGERNAKAKLTMEQVEQIRVSKDGSRSLAATFGVHRTTIQRIRRGAQWV